MITFEKHYKAKAFFNENKDTTWDSFREKSYKVYLFGIRVYKKTENLDIDYSEIELKKLGFKK